MVKKLRKTAEKKAASPASLLDSQLAATVRDSAQQIWLAGLGAFAKAQEEGTKVFEALVREGATIQTKTQAAIEGRPGPSAAMSAMAGEITSRAGQHWDKLEAIFEDRVAKALNRLGVPSYRDLAALTARIEELDKTLSQLSKSGVSGTASVSSKAPSKAARQAAPKAAATKPASKATTERKANEAGPAASKRVARRKTAA